MLRLAGSALALSSLAASGLQAQSHAGHRPPLAAASGQARDPIDHAVPRPIAVYAAQPQFVSFELFRGSRIFLKGAINGLATEMMLDSGASSTVLDTAFAARIGVKGDRPLAIRGAAGSVPGEVASNVTIEVGGLRLEKATVLIMDLSHVAGSIGRPIPVVLGHDALDAGPFSIDFPKHTVSFLPSTDFSPPEGATRIPLGKDGPFRSVKLSIEGLPAVDATFDIGNGGTVLLAKSYWQNQSALTRLRSADTQVGGVGGMKPARKVTLPTINFAGQTLNAVPAVLNEDPTALPTEGANLGIEMLKPFIVTADYAKDVMYLQRGGDWSGFQKERAGVRTELRGDRLSVGFVSAQGPGAKAGLKAGDEIIAVDGKPIDSHYYTSGLWEWIFRAAGSTVELTMATGSKLHIRLDDYY